MVHDIEIVTAVSESRLKGGQWIYNQNINPVHLNKLKNPDINIQRR